MQIELTEVQQIALKRLRFSANTAHCSNCGKGPFMVKGPLGGTDVCPGCSHPVDPSDVKEKGLPIPGEVVVEWWQGQVAYCAFCSSLNTGEATECEKCGAELEGAIRPDISKMSAEFKEVLKAVGIDLEAPVKQSDWKREMAAMVADETPVSAPQEEEAAPVVVPQYDEPEIQPARRFSFPSWIVPAGIVAILLVALIAGLVWLLKPKQASLIVDRFEYELISGFDRPTVVNGECYSDTYGDDCDYPITPVSTLSVDFVEDGYVVVATVISTKISEETEYDTSHENEEIVCDTTQLENMTVELTCTPTPIPYVVTVVSETSEDITATKTPYARNQVNYSKDVIIEDTVSTGILSGRPEYLSMPEIPYGTYADTFRDSVMLWVIFKDSEGREYRLRVFSQEDWYNYFQLDQTFPDAKVNNGGSILDLVPGDPSDPSD